MSTVSVMTEYLTLDSLDAVLNEVGLSVNNVAANPFTVPSASGMYFDAVRDGNGKRQVVLVIMSFALDENRKRYMGQDGKVAMETRRFFVESLGRLIPCPTMQEQESKL